MEDWAEIRRLHRAEGLSIKMISRVMRVSRNTVRAALASDAPPKYQRPPAPSIVDEFEPRIRELLRAFPTMQARGRGGLEPRWPRRGAGGWPEHASPVGVMSAHPHRP